MCGICGIFHYALDAPVARPLVESMAASLRHRGPDDDGFHVDGRIGLGFRRLSIIDLETGHQPIPNEDESRWVILNGEIYNYRELRRELEAAGHRFRTRSDTETIVHGHEEWGADVTRRLNGIFGLAVWDARAGRLLLARDHLGVKPLYYHDDGRRLLFGSEIKALLQDESVPRALDEEALAIFLSLGYVPSPRTLFRGIRKLPPGHRLRVDAAGARLERYWNTIPELHDISENEAVEEYARRFRLAVERQMVSDVPVGSLLSGGVDSALVTAVMREVAQGTAGGPLGAGGRASGPVMTFSVGFEEEGDWNELVDAAESSRLLGTEHRDLRIHAGHYVDFFPESLWHLEEPVLSQSTFAFYFLAKLARRSVKVVLTGQGADEPLAGYDRYRGEKLAASLGWLAASPVSRRLVAALPRAEKLRRAARSLGERDPLQRFARIHALFAPADLGRLLQPELAARLAGVDPAEPLRFWQRDVQHLDGLSQLLYVDTRMSLPDDLLLYGDKLAMASSLEVRVPILDVELVEFVETLPPALKLRGLTGKHVHKLAARRWLPEAVIRRRKKGFGTPVDAWFQRELDGFVRGTLLAPGSVCREYFVPRAVEKLLLEHRERRRDHRRRIFALLSFELWHRRFLQSPVAIAEGS
jgi:asparagine synthase (glutamine-hydrolysing)